MTWFELKQFINNMNGEILNSDVKLYDFATGDEHEAGITELLIAESNDDEECEGWVPYISINEEEKNHGKTKKASVS
jgi:hypothetical protein